MNASEQKIVQYLNETHAMEKGLERALQEQIAIAPRGRLRDGLEQHLKDTRSHAERVRTRVNQLDGGSNPIQLGIGLVQSVVGQAVALGKTPLDLVRGNGGSEKVLKNAKDACAAESLEIATYTALERLAESVDDRRTAELARSICADEQRMLKRLLDELPQLTESMVASEIRGEDTFALSETGAADVSRAAGRSAKRTAKRTAKRARTSAKKTTASAQRTAKRAQGSAGRRAGRTAGSGQKRSRSTQARSGTARTRASSGQSRPSSAPSRSPAAQGTAQSHPDSLAAGSSPDNSSTPRTDEPRYDNPNVNRVRASLGEERMRRVRTYEKAHKDHSGQVDKTENETHDDHSREVEKTEHDVSRA